MSCWWAKPLLINEDVGCFLLWAGPVSFSPSGWISHCWQRNKGRQVYIYLGCSSAISEIHFHVFNVKWYCFLIKLAQFDIILVCCTACFSQPCLRVCVCITICDLCIKQSASFKSEIYYCAYYSVCSGLIGPGFRGLWSHLFERMLSLLLRRYLCYFFLYFLFITSSNFFFDFFFFQLSCSIWA